MGMKNKMAKIASIAAMMAIANGDEVYDLPQNNSPKNTLSKGEKKKCKSCENYKKQIACRKKGGNLSIWWDFPRPMDTACDRYERKKKSR